MIYYIPIEPYKTRYTADWITQFETEFINHGIQFMTILGKSVSNRVSEGGVLDTCGTHVYKFSQLSKLMMLLNDGAIKDGDILFFADLWFPGLESLFYVRNMTGINFKVCGIFHAGTYDPADFTYRSGMRPWGKFLEANWFVGVDKVFVATEFHKNLLLKNSSECLPDEFDSDKIVVTGLPFYGQLLHDDYIAEKEDIIVFPHRLDPEKHPEKFDRLVEELRGRGLKFIAIKTIPQTKSREEYFKILGRSKVMVSFADQETFGYSTLESMALDNIVIVPNRLSYVETVPERSRYNSEEVVVEMVEDALVNYKNPRYDTARWSCSINRMLQEMN